MGKSEDRQYEEYMEKLQSRANSSGVQSYIETNAGVFQMGAIFEAETTRGGKNYITFFFLRDHYVYYCHGDKAKKVREDQFLKLIDYGDLVPVPREKADPERLAFSVLGMKAMSEGLAFNDYMKVMWGYGQGSEAGQFNTKE